MLLRQNQPIPSGLVMRFLNVLLRQFESEFLLNAADGILINIFRFFIFKMDRTVPFHRAVLGIKIRCESSVKFKALYKENY